MVSIVAPIAILGTGTISVGDRHHLDDYPDLYPTFHFYAYPDPESDPDPDPSYPRFTRVGNKNFVKIFYSQQCQVSLFYLPRHGCHNF